MKVEDWPAEVVPQHIGNLIYVRRLGAWMAVVDRKHVTFHASANFARGHWLRFLERYGHARPVGGRGHFVWRVALQKWVETKPDSRFEYRSKTYEKLKEQNRTRRKQMAKGREVLRKNTKQRFSQLRKKMLDAARRRINDYLERRMSAIGEIATKEFLRTEKLQRIGQPWKERETAQWYAWIGRRHRKLVRLGDNESDAKKVWRLLDRGLKQGSELLRTQAGVQRTLDELVSVSPERVESRLRELGWLADRPKSSRPRRNSCPNTPTVCQTG